MPQDFILRGSQVNFESKPQKVSSSISSSSSKGSTVPSPVPQQGGRINSVVINKTPGISNDVQAIRLRQQKSQVTVVSGRISAAAAAVPVAKYVGRDPKTGQRIMQAPDGGKARISWIAPSKPKALPELVAFETHLGRPGYAGQK
jgi:hypothetical protein